ncbi:hypothetical protein ACIBQ1_42650 [Nonomuraea sp. NPDC050153]|uniref:hypothetical protein n=1 Tax=Nonomuraea sp. NPDC050153 TaxID=3364359 RepID=UPI00378B02D1
MDQFALFNLPVPRQAPYSMQHAFTLTEPGSIVLSCHAIPGWTARVTNIQLTEIQASAAVNEDIRVE